MLKIDHLTKTFKKVKAVDDLSFEFTGGVYGLLGANGAGKTTLLRCIAGLYPTENGVVLYNGAKTGGNKEYLEAIGYLPQAFGMYKELSVKEMMLMFANLKNISSKESESEIERVLTLVNLENKTASKVGTLSGGMVRRLGIAQALLGSPKIIIFDEPTAGLDPEERLRFKNIISEIPKDVTVIISTHIVEDVEAVCDKVVIMNKGKLITSGSSEDVKNIAADKVYFVPEYLVSNISEEHTVEKYFEKHGEKYARVLSREKLPFEKGEPTVEDGYICVVKNI